MIYFPPMALLASTASWAMFSVGVVLMILILLRRTWRYQRRSLREDRPRAAKAVQRSMTLADAPNDVLRWQVEMHETARDLKAELDSKMGALQVLVRLAAEEADRLEAAVQEARRLGISACRDSLEGVALLAEGEGQDGEGGLPAIRENSVAELLQPSHKRTEVYALADAGQSAPAIAERVGLTVGEVELMLSVRAAS